MLVSHPLITHVAWGESAACCGGGGCRLMGQGWQVLDGAETRGLEARAAWVGNGAGRGGEKERESLAEDGCI